MRTKKIFRLWKNKRQVTFDVVMGNFALSLVLRIHISELDNNNKEETESDLQLRFMVIMTIAFCYIVKNVTSINFIKLYWKVKLCSKQS